MEGVLKHNGKNWVVSYCNRSEKELPLYYKDDKIINELFKRDEVKPVLFEIIDEFSHPQLFQEIPWGEGDYCAKLTEK